MNWPGSALSGSLIDAERPAASGRPSDSPTRGIELVQLSHRYDGAGGAVQALEPTNLSIPAGQFVALVGPSGCGKTTLLRIVTGLLEPTTGQVMLAGASPAQARHRRAIGWLAQEDGLLPWRRVADNVGLPLRLAGRTPNGQVDRLLDQVGLADSARRYPHELSVGMRQRAALARSLVASPEFLLLDEPFSHLDELIRERLGDLVLELRSAVARPPTTLLVTHSLSEAVQLAERVVVFSARPGRVVADVSIGLSYPRAVDQPGFGALVKELKSHFVTPV